MIIYNYCTALTLFIYNNINIAAYFVFKIFIESLIVICVSIGRMVNIEDSC